MGTVELWLGPAGCGKTGKALQVLREELDRDWRGVRYLVPTVAQKRSIEHLLLERGSRQGLFGDPVTTFFNFAEEVAARAHVQGRKLSELQKHLMLKDLVRKADLDFFARAAKYPGFVTALGDAIDELKVHMVRPDTLIHVATKARERGARDFANKLDELGQLYGTYQTRVYEANLYDNEGIMWIAAECLSHDAALFSDLHCLILDGFARLTPIQVEFLRTLAPRVGRIIVLFDYEEDRTAVYHPVRISLNRLTDLRQHGLRVEEISLAAEGASGAAPQRALSLLRHELFRDRRCPPAPQDDSVALFVGATPAHQLDLIAREVRAMLRAGRLADGTPITPGDIAVLARYGDGIRERIARAFSHYGLTIRRDPEPLAHTPVGRALLAAFRLVRQRWQRDDLLTLLKSGMLAIDPAVAFQVDLVARTQNLRDGRASWLRSWPEDDTRDLLQQALAPLAAFDTTCHHGGDARAIMEATAALLRAFRAQRLPDVPPLPDADHTEAHAHAALDAAFTCAEAMLTELQGLAGLLGGFPAEEVLEVISTALLREAVPDPGGNDGIPVLSAHTTGGEKFKVVFLCDLLQGNFPRHVRESAFLMDHERDETLRDLDVVIETRKGLEEDEQYWFLHALSTAKRRLVLCYPQHDAEGNPLERSAFLDEVEKVLPNLPTRTTSFRDVVPPLPEAETSEEYLAGLAFGLKSARTPAQQGMLAAAYAALPRVHGQPPPLATLYRRAAGQDAALTAQEIVARLVERRHPFSASELQSYIDCPFLWFGSACLGVAPVEEEFSALDRGVILHGVLEKLYRDHQTAPGVPVHLEDYTIDELWPEVERDLRARLEQEPRFTNKSTFIKEIEWEALTRTMRRFLASELERARTRGLHPAFFEEHFGFRQRMPVLVADGAVALRGKIDRIDVADDGSGRAVVIDYKSSASMTAKELEAGELLQAPVYVFALEQLFKLHPLGAEFMGIKQGEGKGVFRQEAQPLYGVNKGMKLLDDERWEALCQRSHELMGTAARSLRAGDITRAPTTSRCPGSCPHNALCRGDHFALARQVREANTTEEEADAEE